MPALPDWGGSRVVDADLQIVIPHGWNERRKPMWNHVGMVRATRRLSALFMHANHRQAAGSAQESIEAIMFGP